MSETAAARGPYGVPDYRAGWDSVDEILAGWAAHGLEMDFTPVGVVTRLAKVRVHLDSQIGGLLAGHGLTPADFQVIVTLRRAGDAFRMPQARLMDALELTSGTVSVRIDRLEKIGIVARLGDPENARSTLIQLTAKGTALFDVVAPAHLANEDRLLSALSPDERQTLADLLRRLLYSYESRDIGAAAPLGLQLEPAPIARRRRQSVGLSDTPGLLISHIEPPGAAAKAGLARGDLIIELDRQAVRSGISLAEALDDEARRSLDVTVLRGETRLTRTIAVPSADNQTGDGLRD